MKLESIQFHHFDGKIVIIQYKIDSFEFDRFQTRFVTDKYINICQWEYILGHLDEMIKDIINYSADWEHCKGDFRYQDLKIKYKFVSKSEGYLDYDNKFPYAFDWIIKVQIDRLHEGVRLRKREIENRDDLQKSKKLEAKNQSSLDEESEKSQTLNNTDNHQKLTDKKAPMNQHTKIYTIDIENSDNDELENRHETKRAKIDQNLKRKNGSPSKKPGTSRKISSKEPNKQGNITDWITTKSSKKATEVNKTPKNKKVSKDPLGINKEQIEQMNNFVLRSEQEEERKSARKLELEDYEILNCNDVNLKCIKSTILSMKGQIMESFAKDSSSFIVDNKKINPLDITSSNVLTQDQCMTILNEIENIRDAEDVGTKEQTLHNVVFPAVIIEIFRQKYNLTVQEALLRIYTQEEKKTLFNMQLNDSH